MKKVRKLLPALALVFGVGFAVAQNLSQTTYRILATGQVVDEQTAQQQCPGAETACAIQESGPNPGELLFLD